MPFPNTALTISAIKKTTKKNKWISKNKKLSAKIQKLNMKAPSNNVMIQISVNIF